ncbi:MAG: TraR/DksA family transcriptional regulator [Acidobacteria bacterium]|nr:MAG: TraR/DksA family transcriptional regulator [Acidobacteriota bacterium]REK09139.1 MAG: TraR/DksA family transcriptional regulator [Acidobacteriota bacterium]
MIGPSEEQLTRLHERLLAAREIAQALLGRRDARVEASGQTIGRLTRMDALQLQGMSQLSRGQLAIRMQQIEAALRAWEAGRYGACNRCRQPIDTERLEALPEAPLCLPCQEAIEAR